MFELLQVKAEYRSLAASTAVEEVVTFLKVAGCFLLSSQKSVVNLTNALMTLNQIRIPARAIHSLRILCGFRAVRMHDHATFLGSTSLSTSAQFDCFLRLRLVKSYIRILSPAL